MRELGRMLVFMGSLLVLFGLLLSFYDKLPLRLGRLPGDFLYRGKNTVFYFPLGTSILLSVLLTLLLWMIGRRG